MNLYISNLSPETTEADLEKAFSEFGAIKSLKIIIDRETGISKGFGFVEMEDKFQAMDAIDFFDMSFLKGNIINVREAKNNKDGSSNANNHKRKFNSQRSFPNHQNTNTFKSYNTREEDFNNDLSYNA
jgi:RNA recognition motif-containing protein